MARVLLTGGNGYIATHILAALIDHGCEVTITTRSKQTGAEVLAQYNAQDASKITLAIVSNFAEPGAFDACLQGCTAVIHVASPYYFTATDYQQELYEPSIEGTLNLLRAVRDKAPLVTKVILTSSFAAILNSHQPNTWNHTYTEDDWNPLTWEEGQQNGKNAYRASKIFAERAAWDFVKSQQLSFTLTTICPAFVFGPLNHPSMRLNTSSQRISSFLTGEHRHTGIPDTGVSFFLYVDVRDLAVAHVRAIDVKANTRYLLAAGYFTNKEICQIIRKRFPEYEDLLPSSNGPEGGRPKGGLYGFDNTKAIEDLGLKSYRSLEESVVDTVLSLKRIQELSAVGTKA